MSTFKKMSTHFDIDMGVQRDVNKIRNPPTPFLNSCLSYKIQEEDNIMRVKFMKLNNHFCYCKFQIPCGNWSGLFQRNAIPKYQYFMSTHKLFLKDGLQDNHCVGK